ncbi:U32 family peptidase [Celerinatantimonas sp. YJH-8]
MIIQDLGLGYILKHYFPMLDVHASTQLNTHNEGQIRFLSQLGVSRVNLSRELALPEITHLSHVGKQYGVLMEVFVHGSYCIGFSGLCYISSARNGSSGNRGRCSQPCRDKYQMTEMGVTHPLNLKDNTAFEDFTALADAGVYSLKIEGRMKQAHYVYTVVEEWRQLIDHYEQQGELLHDTSTLYKVFNRDFSAGYLKGVISKEMYIDNPRNHAADHFAQLAGVSDPEQKQSFKRQVYDENTRIIEEMNQRIVALDHEPHKPNGKRHKIADIRVPTLSVHSQPPLEPKLNILISDPQDIAIYSEVEASLYYLLPSSLQKKMLEMVALFTAHPQLIPYFPAILIGDNFAAAETFLMQVRPARIVTNNLGVGWLAKALGISWWAGPQLNLTNSYALYGLQQEYGCSGAFISNEISAMQMKQIVRPEHFRLCHSIYHPMNLLTSRQCLFQQTVGCRKSQMTRSCLSSCQKSAAILNLNGSAFVIDKQAGEHNSLYHQYHFMNLDVAGDLPNLYTDLFIDLRDVHTETRSQLNKFKLAQVFADFCQPRKRAAAKMMLESHVQPTTYAQYLKGL